MILDNNLKDHSDEVIQDLRQELTKACKGRGWYRILSIILLFCLAVVCVLGFRDEKIIKELTTQVEQDEQLLTLEYSIGYWFINQPEEVNDSILYQFLIENNAWYPDILLKQAKIESGNYTSNIYKNTCNLYGMRKVGKRQTTQVSTYNGYGVYNNWCLSVLDRMLWDEFTFKGIKPSKEEYLAALVQYAEDNTYINKLI